MVFDPLQPALRQVLEGDQAQLTLRGPLELVAHKRRTADRQLPNVCKRLLCAHERLQEAVGQLLALYEGLSFANSRPLLYFYFFMVLFEALNRGLKALLSVIQVLRRDVLESARVLDSQLLGIRDHLPLC